MKRVGFAALFPIVLALAFPCGAYAQVETATVATSSTTAIHTTETTQPITTKTATRAKARRRSWMKNKVPVGTNDYRNPAGSVNTSIFLAAGASSRLGGYFAFG